MRKVLYISGSRADYGPALHVLEAIRDEPGLELSILATAMHLDPVHGETWREIEADGFVIAEKIKAIRTDDSLSTMASSVGFYLQQMSRSMARLRPDVVLVLGDRGEQLAGAMAAAFQNIAVVHLCGGAVSGSIDDSIRHAITKFSHYHLAGYDEHARRIVQMGEDPSTVRVVGLPGADLRLDATLSAEVLRAQYDLPSDEPYLLVIQHAVTQSQQDAAVQITETLEAVLASGYMTLLANPNDDAGGRAILSVMKEYAAAHPRLRLLPPPASRSRFASLMAHAGALVGNSSSALAEAMSVPLPVVNIGDRQRGRERLACWISVGCSRREILDGIRRALEDPSYRERLSAFHARLSHCDTPRRVVECLKTLDLDCARKPKTFHDMILRGYPIEPVAGEVHG